MPPAPTPRVPAPYVGRHRADVPATPPAPVPLGLRPDDDLDPSQDDGGLESLMHAGFDGHARRPLLTEPAWARKAVGVLASAGLFALMVAGVGGAVTAASPETNRGPVVATYTRPDGSEMDLRLVSCRILADDVVESDKPINGNKLPIGPERLRRLVTVTDRLDQVADLPKGDIARTALVCRAEAVWLTGTRRPVELRLVVEGAESSMDSTTVQVRR